MFLTLTLAKDNLPDSCRGCFTLRKRGPGTHWTGVSIGFRDNINIMANRKVSTHGRLLGGFTMSRLALGPTQFHIQCVPGVKWTQHGADHSALSNAVVKNAWSYRSSSLHVFMALFLNKQTTGDNFTSTFPQHSHLSISMHSTFCAS